jgi:hypothetical protein
MNASGLGPMLAVILLAGCATSTTGQRAPSAPLAADQRRITLAGNDYVTRDQVTAKFNRLASEACGGSFSGAPQVDFDQTWFGKFYLTRYSAQGDVTCGK